MTTNAPVRHYVRRCSAFAVVFTAMAALLLASPARAQSAGPQDTEWTRGTTLNLFGGVGADQSHTGGAMGGALGWEVTRRFGIEGAGTWFARGTGATGFSADLAALFSLGSSGRVVPFVKGGAGLYHASFDPTRSPMPDFYRNRVESAGGFNDYVAFTDPTVVVGAGVTMWVTENVSIRPEVDFKIAIRGSDAYALTAAGARIAYHFVDRPREYRSR